MILRQLLIVAVLFLPSVLWADTSTFTIGVLGGDDTEPPTEPLLQSVVPVAATQIDLTWSASTDNVYLAGYVLLRDAVAIATTTLTTYTDAGLTASTTYAYSVYAFDAFGNMSTTSPNVATTTFALPVVVEATSTPTQSTQVLGIRSFSLEVTPHEAQLAWQTSRPARYELRWGRTDAYELGYVISDVYRTNQETAITELEPGTTYMYELIGYDARGFSLDLRSGSFTTKSLAAGVPANVQNFRATLLSGGEVELRYAMPAGFATAPVRIVRSYFGYPRDPFDGAVIFDGEGSAFVDTKAFLQGDTEYYAVFVHGPDGTYSSGAVARVQKNPAIEPGVVVTPDGTETPTEVEIEEIPLPDFDFKIEAIEIIQGEERFTFASSSVTLALDTNTLIRIPYQAVPDTLKSLVVTLTDPADSKRSYSFLLRINKDRTAYEAVVAPLGVAGPSRIVVEIFDYERSVVGRYQKAVMFVQSETAPVVVFPDQIVQAFQSGRVALGGGIALILLGLWFWWRRRAEDKQ